MDINSFILRVNHYILNPIIGLLFALAFVYFVYGIIKFIRVNQDEKGTGRIEARDSILWGIVGMVIMFSVFGLIKFVLATFGISPNDIGSDSAKNFLGLFN
jgi:hypothetical protein